MLAKRYTCCMQTHMVSAAGSCCIQLLIGWERRIQPRQVHTSCCCRHLDAMSCSFSAPIMGSSRAMRPPLTSKRKRGYARGISTPTRGPFNARGLSWRPTHSKHAKAVADGKKTPICVTDAARTCWSRLHYSSTLLFLSELPTLLAVGKVDLPRRMVGSP